MSNACGHNDDQCHFSLSFNLSVTYFAIMINLYEVSWNTDDAIYFIETRESMNITDDLTFVFDSNMDLILKAMPTNQQRWFCKLSTAASQSVVKY
jgi:hypothetical protein